ncbi:MAG: hypothetical protein ACK5TM_08665 [Methylobacterium sp.]|jgi:hypothetical protein
MSKVTKTQYEMLRAAITFYGFIKASHEERTCVALRRLGYVTSTMNGWQITDAGRVAVAEREQGL